MDKIIIKDAEIFCKIGVTSKERGKKQKLLVTAELYFDTKRPASTDDIKNTINYSEVLNLIKVISGKKGYKLIETLANVIADVVMRKFKPEQIIVNIKKKVAGMKHAAVEISRK